MNAKLNRTALAVAVASLFAAAPAAWAQSCGDTGVTCNININYTLDQVDWVRNNTYTLYSDEVVNHDENVDTNSDTQIRYVRMNKDLSLVTDITISGAPVVSGNIEVDSAAVAVIDNRQSISSEWVENDLLNNTASIGDAVGQTASGNLGFNVAAGDNNVQDNAAALSATDAQYAFGMADAEIFVEQVDGGGSSYHDGDYWWSSDGNYTSNAGVTNSASLSGDAFQNASGNIGINITAGNNNMQKNALAASVATTSMAQASVSSNQKSSGNYVSNSGYFDTLVSTLYVTLGGTVSGSNEDGSIKGSYTGTADQRYDMYPDNWGKGANESPTSPHPTTGPWLGHTDWDTSTQLTDINGNNIVRTPGNDPGDPSNDGGSLVMNENGQLTIEEMAATLSGTISYVQQIAVLASNDASLSGNALQNASGNIGVNVSAGTGNMQANSLALAVAQPTTGGGGTPQE